MHSYNWWSFTWDLASIDCFVSNINRVKNLQDFISLTQTKKVMKVTIKVQSSGHGKLAIIFIGKKNPVANLTLLSYDFPLLLYCCWNHRHYTGGCKRVTLFGWNAFGGYIFSGGAHSLGCNASPYLIVVHICCGARG